MKTKTTLVITACLAGVLAGASAQAQSREHPTNTGAAPTMEQAAGSPGVGRPMGPGRHMRHQGGSVTVGQQGDNVVITLRSSRPQAWSYNMATGQLTPTPPEPQENTNPIGGIGVVVKKNPGGSAERTMPASGGSADLSGLEEGGYDITVTFPQTSGAAAPNARLRPQTVTVTMHANVTAEGITIDRGPRAHAKHAINTKGTGAQNGRTHP